MGRLPAADHAEVMSAHELKMLGRRITEELFSQGDLAVADELFAAPEQVKRLVIRLRGAFPDLHGHVEVQVAEEDTLAQRITFTGFGQRFTFNMVHIVRMGPDGLVAEMWSLSDQGGSDPA
jgi:predicted ester cyclase